MRLPLTLATTLCLALLVGYGLLSPAHSEADAIGLPPECVDGTSVGFCHGPQYCQRDTCTSDSSCGDGFVCRERNLCLETHFCGGGRPPPDADSSGTTVQNVTGVCGACAGTCEVSMVCVPGASEEGGCGCSAPGMPRSKSMPIALLGLSLGAVFGARLLRRR